MAAGQIAENYRRIRDELPEHVTIVAAAKNRTPEEIAEVIEAGAAIIGENYVQEAEDAAGALGHTAGRTEWHMIGHLQRNKVNRALPIFDVIQSLDSARLARALDERAATVVRTLLEVNVAGEQSKHGVPPEGARGLLEDIAPLQNVRVEGLMTMEPYFEDAESARPYLQRTRELFEELAALDLPNLEMRTLSMGMTNSYRVAVEEGANMVRIGTAIFGPREG